MDPVIQARPLAAKGHRVGDAAGIGAAADGQGLGVLLPGAVPVDPQKRLHQLAIRGHEVAGLDAGIGEGQAGGGQGFGDLLGDVLGI